MFDISQCLKWMRKDTDHVVFRRFDRLNLYNSLILQHQLADIDRQVCQYEDATNSAESFNKLVQLLDKARPLLANYCMLGRDHLVIRKQLTHWRRVSICSSKTRDYVESGASLSY